MNSLIRLCPKCNKHTDIQIEKDNVHINCQCGYCSIMNINNIMNQQSNSFSDIINDINKGYDHLLTYFRTLKECYINQLKSSINKIESSYEESFKRNMNMLSFIQILIYNYDGSIEMKNNIMNKEINIYKCEENPNADDLIKYYNEYNIIQQKINIEEVKCIKEHVNCVYSLLLLKDKRVASCSDDQTIRIFDPSNDYHCDQVINRHNGSIYSICQLDNGTIVSCSLDKSIMIGDYTIKNAHDNDILKVITLPNNRIASCSDDNTIKIWKSDPPYSNTPIKVLTGHNNWVYSILYIKERDIMISGSLDITLRLWNMSTYRCDKVIRGVRCYWTNALYQIDKDRVIVGDNKTFTIVNIDKCVIENTIIDESFDYANGFLKLRDNHTILCGCEIGIFGFYDMNTKKYIRTKHNHNKKIYDLLTIDEHTFLSCSEDNTIKVWKY